MRNVTKLGENCFNREQRFDIPLEWKTAGIITAVHLALPILMTFIIWLLQHNFKICNIKAISTMPFPFVTKFVNFIFTIGLFSSYLSGEEENETKWFEKIRKNEAIVNISHLIEATMESSFQFWFQTIFLIPTIIISFTDAGGSIIWTDLFNWRIASILISFGTFALTFYNIR